MNPDTSPTKSGRHFLQIPGPTNLPERIAQAISQTTIDHRGPQFAQLTLAILDRLKDIFKTSAPIIIYPSSGSGAWEAALVNTLSPGDRVLFCENGHFAATWRQIASRLGLEVESLPGDWHYGIDPAAVEARLTADRTGTIKAVAIVHNETSTGVVSNVAAVRRAINGAGSDALLMVDTVSSLAAIDYQHDEWGVDVTIAGAQKGLMLPPGLGFNAVSPKALIASKKAALPRAYWAWEPILEANQRGFFPYTPATNLLFGLDEALRMLLAEGLEQVFARHQRLAEATRRAVTGWGLQLFCRDPQAYSATLTAVEMPDGCDADALREVILTHFDMSLGTGLGQARGKLFRIGHLGDLNDLMLAGTLCGIEMGLELSQVPHQPGGVLKALAYLTQSATKDQARDRTG